MNSTDRDILALWEKELDYQIARVTHAPSGNWPEQTPIRRSIQDILADRWALAELQGGAYKQTVWDD